MFVSNVFFILVSLNNALHTITAKENGLELYPPWLETYRYVNESYKVTCRAYEPYTNLTWVKSPNGRSITEKTGRIRTQKIQHGVVLVFENITLDAEGHYKCLATDNGVLRSNGFTLYVAEPIDFSSPTKHEAVINEDVFLECKVNGRYIPDKYWEFNGNILGAGDEPYQYQSEGLSIPNIGLQHAGKYLCVVAHSPFQSNRNRLEVTLTVYSKPMLQDRKKADVTIYGFTNETSTIICAVIANPPTWFIWYSNFEFALNPKNDNVTIISENNTSILQVTLTERRTQETFTCEACNQLGCAEQTFYLKTTTKLKKPDVGLWDTYSDSAKFYISFQKEATYYLFQYFFAVYDYQWEKPFVKNFSVGLRKPQLGSFMSFQLPNLHPDSKYVVKVAAGNQHTISEFSEERKFKTRIGSSIYVICSEASNQKCHSALLIFLLFLCFKHS